MLALAGIPLGRRFVFLDPNADAPAAAVGEVIAAPYDDPQGLDELAERAEVVTYEFEQVPAASAARLAQRGVAVHPGEGALHAAQDRVREKELFASLDIPVPRFAPVDEPDDLQAALRKIGLPAVLKTRSGGYDGKGQAVVRTEADAIGACDALGGGGLIAEELVPFRRELSIIGARGAAGDVAVYPLVENVHRDGILRVSRAPAIVDATVRRRAEEHMRRLMEELDYVGVLAVEVFDRDGELVANEMAPRVHNSGHWTIEGAETSQFENHVRAVGGLPLGSTEPRGTSFMLNLIGTTPPVDELLRLGGHVHLYGKEARPGRKLGHVTVTHEDEDEAARRAAMIQELIDTT